MSKLQISGQEITFGRFHYNLPVSNPDAEECKHTSGCAGLEEHYESLGYVTHDEFTDAAKALHQGLGRIREHAKAEFGLSDANIDFVVGELSETRRWLSAHHSGRDLSDRLWHFDSRNRL